MNNERRMHKISAILHVLSGLVAQLVTRPFQVWREIQKAWVEILE